MPMVFRPEKVIERFWSKVDRSGECWEWTAYRMANGYGTFSPGPGQRALAHRFIEEYMNGPLEDGMIVMHICDNPACVRPSHLRRGTQADNLADMRSKNRGVAPPLITGTRHHSNKLSEDDVRAIRLRRAAGEKGSVIARDFGISNVMVYDIAKGKKWKHIA